MVSTSRKEKDFFDGLGEGDIEIADNRPEDVSEEDAQSSSLCTL